MSTPLTMREQLSAAIIGYLAGYGGYDFDHNLDTISEGLADVLVDIGVIPADQNAWLQSEVARLGADIVGQQNIIGILQEKLHEYELQLNDKLAAAAQAEHVREVVLASGIVTTVVPGGVPVATPTAGEGV